MVLDQRIGLVGRDETVALIESLVRPRPSRPLPIIVAYGPGGSGKSALLDHVERRYRELPISRVNLDGMGSTGCRDVLAAIFDDLRDYPHPEFGRLRLPRYALAKLAMASVGADTGQDTERRTLARNLLAVRLTKLPQATGVVAAAADVMPAAVASAFKALQPFLSWVASFGVVAPRLVRWLLVGPRLARTLRWYETAAISAEHFNLSHDVKAPAVVAELWKQMGEQEKERVRGDLDNASEKRIDRLLVDAFLADITEAFRRRRRRKVTCLVLLDGADLLDPVENSLFEPSQRESVVPASNFLELLVEARLRTPDAPLLVIATKQSKPADPAEEAWPKADPESNPAEVAQKRYDDWAKQFKEANTLYLPVRLRPFTLPQTAQFLAEWSRTQDYTVSSSTLIEELHEVTKGHPLAVQLTVQVTGLRYRANMVQPAVRSAFAQRLPQGQRTADPDVKVGDYLVFRFLQRFRVGDDIEERERTKELLARLAAPHRIDVETIRLLVPGRDPQDVFERLSRYSFTNTAQQDDQVFLTIHPLLRDLLALSLLDQTGPRPYSYRFVHQQLRDRYRSAGNKPEELYHALALGEVDAVAKDLRRRIRESGWPAVLDHIAEAPILDDLRPRRPQSAMELLSTGASWVRHATQPDIVVLSDLVLATQQLRSATSAAGYQARLYGQLSHAYAAVGKQFRLNGHQQVAERETRYLRLAGTATESGREVPQPLPGFCAWDQKMPYPRTRPGRRTRNATVVTGVLALLATYSVVFVVQQSKSCDIGSPIDVPSVVGSMVDRTLGLSRTASHECVGVTDSATSFAFGDTAHPADVTEAKDLNEIAQLSASIYQENRSVDRAGTDSGAPHVTIVVATMLSTVNAQPYRDLTVGVNELRGAYLAQKNWNHIGTSVRPPRFFVRLTLANLGGDSSYAIQVADQIRQLAQRDPTVVAVTGMGQTRDTTLSAADILGTHNAIPMVVSSPTGNKFASKGAVFMTGPSDARQAEVAADFIRSTPQLSSSQNYIVFDPADPYSADLDRSYASALATRQLATASQESYAAGSSDVLDQLQADVNDICRHSTNGAHPLIIYAGRANEFPTFLLHLEDSDCGSRAVLIGDDDFTQTETENYLDLTQLKLQDFANGRVYYTSAGAACLEPAQEAAGACMLNAKSPQRDQFSALYTQAAHEQSHDNGAAFRTGWNGEIMLAFDSVGLVLDATGRVRLPSASDMPNRQQVLRQLQGTTGTAAYQGIAGTIAFGPAANPADPGAGGVDTTKQVVIQVIREQPTGQTRLLPEPAYTEPQP